MLKRLSQRGDTLLEVMVAIATVSVVLGAAYISANRSLQVSRQSQERGEALRIVESQAEQLKVLARKGGGAVFDTANAYCVAFSGANVDKKHTFSGLGPFTTGVTLENDDFSSYPNECKLSFYNTAIKYDAPSAPGRLDDTFTVLVRWDRLGGGKDEVSMVYRLH